MEQEDHSGAREAVPDDRQALCAPRRRAHRRAAGRRSRCSSSIPDFFGGAWVLQPDPIDFRRYQLVDIYSDTNAFVLPNTQFTTTERPFRRTVEGQVAWTLRQLSLFEEVLGTAGRSNYQLEGWEAIYGPLDADGYPKPLWNKLTGTIDRTSRTYMRDNGYDLRDYAQKNWDTLGPKVAGKLHFFAGDMDDFYLNLAVYRFEEFLKGTELGRTCRSRTADR